MNTMSDRAWKAYERRLAFDRLDGRRTGPTYKEDVESKYFSLEAKLLKSLPKMMQKAYEQAVKNCPAGKFPVVIAKEKGRLDRNAFVLMNYEDWSLLARIYEWWLMDERE